MSTIKHQIGKKILPRLPINRRTFDIIRYEVKSLILIVRNAFDWRYHQVVRSLANSRELSVNLGSGGKGLPGWVNIEFGRHADTSLALDIRKPLPLANTSARRVIIEHVLEHLDFRTDAPGLIGEIYRVLAPGGVLRIIVPDCERFLKAYVSGKKQQWEDLGWNIENMPEDIYTPMHIINHTFHQEGEHLFGYDFDTLSMLLRKAGFGQVEKMSFGQSMDPELAIDQPNHAAYSLYVDAVK